MRWRKPKSRKYRKKYKYFQAYCGKCGVYQNLRKPRVKDLPKYKRVSRPRIFFGNCRFCGEELWVVRPPTHDKVA